MINLRDVKQNETDLIFQISFKIKGEIKFLLIMNLPFDIKNDVAGEENDIY